MRYYIDGREISKQEADIIESHNQEIFKSDNIADYTEIQFIYKVADDSDSEWVKLVTDK